MKIDITKIEGYAKMTPEQKIAALEAADIPTTESDDAKKLKATVDALCKEAADYKAKWKATLTESEQQKLAQKEEIDRLKAENAEYKTAQRISHYTAQFIGAGYDEATAKSMAEGLPDGIGEDFFAAQKAFIAAQKQQQVVNGMNNAPKPTAGSPVSASFMDDETQKMLRKQFGLK